MYKYKCNEQIHQIVGNESDKKVAFITHLFFNSNKLTNFGTINAEFPHPPLKLLIGDDRAAGRSINSFKSTIL